MQINATGVGSFAKDAAFGPYLRVVMSNSVIALAGALDREIGTLEKRVLASGLGGSGCDAGVVLPTAQGTVKMIANGAITIFSRVYGAAAGKVSATANGNLIGYALSATAGDGESLEVLRISDAAGTGNLKTVVAAGATITNTVAETAFDAQQQFDANSLKAGDRISFRGKARASATNGTDTLTFKARMGATVLAGQTIATTGALDVANNDVAIIEGEITVRTAGAGGTQEASGWVSIGVPGTATAKIFDLASVALDTTIAQLLGFTATWSVANAGNIVALQEFSVELHRA